MKLPELIQQANSRRVSLRGYLAGILLGTGFPRSIVLSGGMLGRHLELHVRPIMNKRLPIKNSVNKTKLLSCQNIPHSSFVVSSEINHLLTLIIYKWEVRISQIV